MPNGRSPDGTAVPSANPFLRLAWRVVGTAGAALTVFLLVGLALPGTWEVQRGRILAASPQSVFDRVADLDRWPEWMAWGDVEMLAPSASPETRRTWDDPGVGTGSLELLESGPTGVRYVVQVEGGLRTEGRIDLAAAGPGVEVRWTEQGDFGWNPLLAYVALAMDRLQGREMDKALDRLEEIVTAPDRR